MAVCRRLNKLRVLAIDQSNQWHQAIRLFHIITRLGQDDHITVVPLRLHECKRNRIGNTAVHVLATINFHNPCSKRHRSRSLHPGQFLVVSINELREKGLAGFHVRNAHVKFHRVRLKRLEIERIQFLRNRLITEFGIVNIASLDPRTEATKTLVPRKAPIVAQGASRLSGLEIASEAGSG